MLNKVIIWVSRIVAMFLVFIYPIIYLINKFGGTETVQSTQSSMPLVILLIITMLGVIAIGFLINQVFIVYWQYIKSHPFGFISILSFGLIISLVITLAISWLSKLNNLITENTTLFLSDIALYKSSMIHLLVYVGIGLLVGLIGFVYEKTL